MSAELQTNRNAPHLLEKARFKAKAITLIGEGKTDQEIADTLGVSRSAVVRFQSRNRAEIDAYLDTLTTALEQFAIADKRNRMADYQFLRDNLRRDLEENGIAWNEETRYGSKRHLSAAATELRATNQQAALEMDQLPRAGITIANQNVVIVKQVTTEDANPEL